MKISELTINNKLEWETETKKYILPIYYELDYIKAISHNYEKPIKLLVAKEKNSELIFLFTEKNNIEGYRVIFSPYGYSGLTGKNISKNMMSELISYLESKEVITAYLISYPCNIESSKGEELGRTCYLLNLEKSLEDIWLSFNSNYRNEIRKINKNGDTFIEKDKKYLKEILPELYWKTINRKNAKPVYKFNIKTLNALCDLQNSLLLGVKKNKKIISIILIIYNLNFSEYFINACNIEGRSYTKYLLWEAIEELKNLKVKYFNLGGGIKNGDQLEIFKKRFGGSRHVAAVKKIVANENSHNIMLNKYSKTLDNSHFPPYAILD